MKNLFNWKERLNYNLRVDIGLRKIFVSLFIALILIQVVMLNDTFRGIISNDSELEGRPLAVNEMLFDEGKLRLQLIELEPDPKIRITLNGEEVTFFQTSIVEVKVKDGDILGVNCTGCLKNGEIEIVSKTPNVQNDCIGKRFKTNGDPKGTLRIRVGSNGK